MNKINLNEILGESVILPLATCIENNVTVRNVSCIILYNNIYFQSFSQSKKAEQIDQNPTVAVCKDNYEIKGECKNLGSLYENKDIESKYKEQYPEAYEKYKNMKNECVFQIIPKKIKVWVKRNGHTYIDKYDLENNQKTSDLVI